jgi:NADH-quinone oxidoreductase subunit L
MTHAFFKALLFMAAGIVIHALSGEQDIRKMGGLARELPLTYRIFLVGSLALAAIPPFAGFFSKEAILASAANAGALGWSLWSLAAVGAFLTAVYTFRLVFVVFGGQVSASVREHLHKERFEGPIAMVWPVAILGVLAAVGGWLQVPWGWTAVDTWLEPVAESIDEATGGMAVFSLVAALALAGLGILIAMRIWYRPSDVPARITRRWPWAPRALEQKLYFDEAYDIAFYEPSARGAALLYRIVENPLFLGTIDTLGRATRGISRAVAATQTGFVRQYALSVAVGLAILAVVFISVN